jgi:uncharacterized spore protein YtfJ
MRRFDLKEINMKKMRLIHEEFFGKLAEKFHSDLGVQRVYGEPIEFEGRKIIPVANISYAYGFGEGGGWGEAEKASAGETENSEESNAPGGGGYGLGGGSKTEPLGVIEISSEGATFLPVRPKRELVKGLVLGVVIGLVLGRFLRR